MTERRPTTACTRQGAKVRPLRGRSLRGALQVKPGVVRAPHRLRGKGPGSSVLSRRSLMAMIVETVAVQDIQILEEDRCLPPEVCLPQERTLVRRIARLVHGLLDSYSHEESPEFSASCVDKSDAYVAVARKFTRDPMRRKANLDRVEAALASLVESDEAYHLIANHRHNRLDEIREIAHSLSNPQETGKQAS